MLFNELKSVLFSSETLSVKVFKKKGGKYIFTETAELNLRNDSYTYHKFFKTHSNYVVSDLFSTKYGLSIYLDEPEEPQETMPEIASIREMFDDLMQEFEECGVGGLL